MNRVGETVVVPTRLFVDCEFNGFGGQLISMALVAEDGREWYQVLPLPDRVEPWVRENVVPLLGKEPVTPEFFRASLFAFLRQFERPVIVADWYTDLVHFFSQFAGADHSESVAFECSAELRLIEELSSATPHNALADARAIAKASLSARPTAAETGVDLHDTNRRLRGCPSVAATFEMMDELASLRARVAEMEPLLDQFAETWRIEEGCECDECERRRRVVALLTPPQETA